MVQIIVMAPEEIFHSLLHEVAALSSVSAVYSQQSAHTPCHGQLVILPGPTYSRPLLI